MEMKSDAYVSTCVHVLHVRVYLSPFVSTSNLNNTIFFLYNIVQHKHKL